MSYYVANVLGEGITPESGGTPFGALGLRRFDPPADMEDGVFVQYGDNDGACVLVMASSENDAERRIIRALGMDVTIDDLQRAVIVGMPFDTDEDAGPTKITEGDAA